MPLPLFLAPLALKLSPVGKIIKRIPWQIWAIIGAFLLIVGLVWWHLDKVSDAREAGYTQGKADTETHFAAKAAEWVERLSDISAKARSLNDATNRRIAAGADALRVRGPGKAACLNPATPGASRYVAPAGKPDAAGPDVPAGDGEALLAAVPWPWLVDRAEQCDLNRAEAETWRAWHRQLEEAWKKDGGR